VRNSRHLPPLVARWRAPLALAQAQPPSHGRASTGGGRRFFSHHLPSRFLSPTSDPRDAQKKREEEEEEKEEGKFLPSLTPLATAKNG